MTQRCTATNYSRICPHRHTCELHRKYLDDRSGLPVALVNMPVSAVGGECYRYQPINAGIREAVRVAREGEVMKPLTKEQGVVVSAYTGFLICDFGDMHEYIERIMGRPVFTHEMANKETMLEIREAAKADFLALLPEKENQQ